jgi:aspartate--ammonia ligase
MEDVLSKKADLAGPGIGNYEDVEKVLPKNYTSVLSKKETQKAIALAKRYIMDNLNRKLNLFQVEVPLIVDKTSGVNDYLDRDGSRTPVEFHIKNDYDKHPIDAQVVQAATKWKRLALKQFDCKVGEGINTDMRAVRKDYFLDHDHSAYVDQWDWEKAINVEDRNLQYLTDTIDKIWSVITDTEAFLWDKFSALAKSGYPKLPEKLKFIHAEEVLAMFPNLPRKERETQLVQRYPAVFIYGIGATLEDGYPHEMRAPDYDDWITPTITKEGKLMHGLNGDILVWNPLTKRRHELSSMGIRVNAETLKEQLTITGQLDFLELPYHKAIMSGDLPLSIGGGIGQGRLIMLLLQKAHIGEVTVTVWPQVLKDICQKQNIEVLE